MYRTLTLTLALTLAMSTHALAATSPVLLGGAGEFAVLGGSGLTNTGTTTVTGDIGSSPTHSETGFGPCPAAACVVLTGTNHDVADPNDAVTQQAKSDLVIAYNDAFGRTGGTAVSAPLGGGQTLVSGLYTSATDLFVGGDLTLDAGGDPNAVFIFQAKTGTLTTAAGITSGVPNTRVRLANGAQACNVFWQVGSSATISTFTQFLGNVLAAQSITVGTSATLDTGRTLARDGAVTLDGNVIKRADCATPQTPPPSQAPATGTAPATTTAPAPAPAPALPMPVAALLPATANLTVPARAATSPFRISVTGRGIAKVEFFIDGRRAGTVRSIPGRTRFSMSVDPRRRSVGTHRVTARVTFTAARRTPAVLRRATFRRSAPRAPAAPPRFAG